MASIYGHCFVFIWIVVAGVKFVSIYEWFRIIVSLKKMFVPKPHDFVLKEHTRLFETNLKFYDHDYSRPLICSLIYYTQKEID